MFMNINMNMNMKQQENTNRYTENKHRRLSSKSIISSWAISTHSHQAYSTTSPWRWNSPCSYEASPSACSS